MSFEGSNEKLTSSSETNVSMSKNNNSYTTSTTANRISPPPTQLTINQFQPIFKEARKKKQQLNNTKTNDDRKSFSDQTLFKTKYDNGSPTEYIFSERYPGKFKGGENHYVCSSAYSDGYIMCRSLDHQQSNNFIENENNAYVDTIDNLSYGDQCSSGGRDNIYKARIKILVHELGIEKFKELVEINFLKFKDKRLSLDIEFINKNDSIYDRLLDMKEKINYEKEYEVAKEKFETYYSPNQTTLFKNGLQAGAPEGACHDNV